MKRFIWGLLLVLFSSGALKSAIRSGDYTIAGFRKTDRPYPQKSSGIIRTETDSILQELQNVVPVKPGQVLMRKKFEGEYRIYKGELDTALFSRVPPMYYVFTIPGWARLSDIVKYRFYRSPTDKPGTDEDIVYFDGERIYVRQFSRIFYFRNNSWFSLEGQPVLPRGAIELTSNPSGADVIINGEQSGLKTPCTIDRMLPGTYVFELMQENYHFFRKSVRIIPDSTIKSSFELISDMDTVYITGEVPYGLLVLPQPPNDTPFILDTIKTRDLKIRLFPGDVRLRWDGGSVYHSVDTILSIPEGKVMYFDYLFKRRYGVLRIVVSPPDAEVCFQNGACMIGEQVMETPSGVYTIDSYRHGFRGIKKEISVIPDTINTCYIDLQLVPDRDGDGFLDSLDKCPDEYGLHDGCPKQKLSDALSSKKEEIQAFLRNDQFTIGVTLLGLITRIPTKKHFANFLSTFSSGKIGGINNYRGLTFFNTLQMMYRGLFCSVELGQWTAGIHYERSDTMHLATKTNEYLVIYDSVFNIEPALFIPSTGVSLGFHYNWSWLNVIYSIGYQWEDIILDQIYNTADGSFTRITFDNDWWFHQLHAEADMHIGDFFAPSIYCRFKFPFGPTKRTRWHTMQAGLQLKVTPSMLKKRNSK